VKVLAGQLAGIQAEAKIVLAAVGDASREVNVSRSGINPSSQ
jgi:hypothetical protein